MKYIDAGAWISVCGLFRYSLWRHWDKSKRVLVWIMLNPSTADGRVDDRTILKCVLFARLWGFGGIEIVNLYAYRATSPTDMKAAGYPTGGEANGTALFDAMEPGTMVMVGWGVHARAQEIDAFVGQYPDQSLYCLGENKDGSPKHPLYIANDTKPARWYPRLW